MDQVKDSDLVGKIAVGRKGWALGEIVREYGNDDNPLIIDKEHFVVKGGTWFYDRCLIVFKRSLILKIQGAKVWLNITKKDFRTLVKQYWSTVAIKGRQANATRGQKEQLNKAIVWDRYSGP